MFTSVATMQHLTFVRLKTIVMFNGLVGHSLSAILMQNVKLLALLQFALLQGQMLNKGNICSSLIMGLFVTEIIWFQLFCV